MKNESILVLGARGNVGSELVRLLKQQNRSVKLATSQQGNLPADHVHLDLTTGQGIAFAFENVDRAFLLCPPGHADQYALLSPLIQEAKRRGLKKVVLMTAMGANANEASPFRKAELDLERSGLNFNIIRPNWFMQNFNTFWIHGIMSEDKILLPAGKAKVSFIDARDISAVAATLLTKESDFDKKAFDLTGAEAFDHEQVAQAISQVAGRPIHYQEVTPEDFHKGLTLAGLPAAYADFLVMIFGFLREGYSAPITTSVKDILQVAPRGLAQYALDYKKSWKK